MCINDFGHVWMISNMLYVVWTCIGEFGHVCMNSDMLYEFDVEMWLKWYIVAHI
jgi:hypothetical protein